MCVPWDKLIWPPFFNCLSLSLHLFLFFCLCGVCYLATPAYACLVQKQPHANRFPNILYAYDLKVCKMNTATLFFFGGFMPHICIHENTHRHAPRLQSRCVFSHTKVRPLILVTSRGQQRHFTLSRCWAVLCMQEMCGLEWVSKKKREI